MAALKNPLCSYTLLKIISCGEIVIATFPFYHTYWPLDHLTGKVQCEDQYGVIASVLSPKLFID
ncbi:hypothetical protein T07_11727 [Trichinella nelsoni]|uniref:Uncharacterized protein n=1 Tax=Trichinella nelsoni TaxID=6336 RepID=A0A0V0REH6_9BILA|nr:hypothetical protein T07_11727 [Trichinella nelsoni]